MSSEKPYVSIPSKDGERIRKHLHTIGLLDSDYRILSEDDMLYLPLNTQLKTSHLEIGSDKISVGTGYRAFEKTVQGPKTLVEALEGKLPDDELALVPRAYDLIGDIAILEIPEELSHHSQLIGHTFHDLHKSIRTVLAKCGAISGTTRVRDYDFLAGDRNTKTIHTEYGCRLAVDVTKAYFSPRLLEEHHRIAQAVIAGETIVDMFCGVGPFSIHIAREKKVKIFAIDINPAAIDLLRESIELNKLLGTITPIVADAHDYVDDVDLEVNRVIMNHPSGASHFIHDACIILKSGGMMHYYDFMGGESPETLLKEKLASLIKNEGRSIKQFETIRRVRDSAPYEYQMVADVIIS